MFQHYQIRQRNGTVIEAEGELSEWNGKRVLLDGERRPWLLITDGEVVMPAEGGNSSEEGVTPGNDREHESRLFEGPAPAKG